MDLSIIKIDKETFQVIPMPFRYEENCIQWFIFEGRVLESLSQKGDIVVGRCLDEYPRQKCQKIIASTMMLAGVPRIMQRRQEF